MRLLACLIALGVVFTGNAAALEAAAGSENVNTSQIGLSAKIDATQAITTAAINQILSCGKSGKLFDSVTNVCIAVDESLAKKIAACTTTKTFYNQTTDVCQALDIPPDTSAQTNSNTALLNKIVACNNNKQFYNSTTGTCAAGSAGGTPVPDLSQCADFPEVKGTLTACPADRVMVGVTAYGVETGAKLWHARFKCCALKMQ